MTAHSVTARTRARIPSVHMLSRTGELRFATKTRFAGAQVFVNPRFTGISSVGGVRTAFVAVPSGFQGRITTAFGQAASRKVEQAALRKLALRLVAKKAFGVFGEIAPTLIQSFYKRHIEPDGFPGFGNFTAGWTSNAGAPWPGIVPGDYTINGFDVSQPWGAAVPNMVDANDGDIFGLRYWGHYDADPFLGFSPAVDWATRTTAMPRTTARPRPQTKYRQLPDLAPELQVEPWGPRKNIEVTIGTAFREPFRVDVPRIRDRGDKAKPSNMFIWAALRGLVDAGGESKEWIDILAEASGYVKGSMMLPEELRGDAKQTQAKTYWIFFAGGLSLIDWDKLAVLIVENEIEDRIYGALGQLSKHAGRSLGLTVGPQTGLVM